MHPPFVCPSDDDATTGSFKVGDFEDMLHTVHNNLIVGYPLCGMDKWEDNHYAIDSFSADTSAILSYVESANVTHLCTSQGGSTSLHYVVDPTGWLIQLDLGFSSAPSDCATGLRDHTNPACSPGTCAPSATSA